MYRLAASVPDTFFRLDFHWLCRVPPDARIRSKPFTLQSSFSVFLPCSIELPRRLTTAKGLYDTAILFPSPEPLVLPSFFNDPTASVHHMTLFFMESFNYRIVPNVLNRNGFFG
jgi:hypothetical protein